MQSFSELKRSRSSEIEALSNALAKVNERGRQTDDRFWQPTRGKDGNGSAVIRFLPAPQGERTPFIRYWSHGFKGPTGKWYIENSLTSLDKPDPVGELNRTLWSLGEKGDERAKKQASAQKRRLHFVSNVYVIKDPANPANEGKVFLYRYGSKIFDKLNDAMNPEFADQEKVNPFCLWGGANFRMRITTQDKFPNYDKSTLDAPGPLLNDDDELEKIWKSEYSLQELLSPSNFKPYDELKRKLYDVLGMTGGGGGDFSPSDPHDDDTGIAYPGTTASERREDQKTTEQRFAEKAPAARPASEPARQSGSPEAPLDFFQSLAGE